MQAFSAAVNTLAKAKVIYYKDKETYKKGLTLMSGLCYNNNEDITKILMVKSEVDEEPTILSSKFWISDLDRYRQFLRRYNLK